MELTETIVPLPLVQPELRQQILLKIPKIGPVAAELSCGNLMFL